MMLKRTVITTLLFISVALFLYSQDQDISRLYSDEAAKLYLAGHHELAASCAITALEFDPDNADALFVKAFLLYENSQGRTGEAAELLLTALENDTWSFFSAAKGKEAAFRFLYEAGAYEKAVDLVDEPFLSYLGNEELYFFYTKSLEKTGKIQDALRLAHYGNSLFHSSHRFKEILLRIDEEFRAAVIEDLRKGNDAAIPLEIIPSALEATNNLALRKMITEYYLEKGGNDLSVLIEKIRFEPSFSKDDLEDLAQAGLFNHVAALKRLLSYVQTREDMSIIRERFSQFSGITTADYDDVWQTETRFSEGSPVEMKISSKDGKEYIEVSFRNGDPLSLKVTKPEKSFEFTYTSYPDLGSVEMITPEGKTLYILRQGLQMPVLENAIAGYPLYSYHPDRLMVREEEIALYAGHMVTMTEDLGSADRVYTSEREGFQHESLKHVLDKTLVLQEGLPVDGVMDLDQDGFYETHLEFQEGELTGMMYDGNRNGVPEYFYYPGEKPIEMWDFDEDGFIDIREYNQEEKRYVEYFKNKGTFSSIYVREGSQWREIR